MQSRPGPERAAISASAWRACRNPANVGALLRTAHAFGAAFCFTIGAGWDSRAGALADTADTPGARAAVALRRCSARLRLPQGCVLVGIELLEDAVELPSFRHPLNAAYVLGPERAGLSPALLARCRHVVRIPTRFALNLAVAGALVLYDRLLQHGRFAERPVASGGAGGAAAAPARPRRRRCSAATMPDWVETATRNGIMPRLVRRPLHPVSLPPCASSPVPDSPALRWRSPSSAAHRAEPARPIRRRIRPRRRPPQPQAPKAHRQVRRLDGRDPCEAGQTVCYAFTRAEQFHPGAARPRRRGADRHRARRAGATRWRSAPASPTPPNADGERCRSTRPSCDFYTAQRSAFARDGHAAVAAFEKGRQAMAHSPGPRQRRGHRHVQPARLQRRLCRDQQGVSGQMSAALRRRSDRGRARAHPGQVRAVRPAAGHAAGRPARPGRPVARRAGRRAGRDRREAVPRQAALALDLSPGRAPISPACPAIARPLQQKLAERFVIGRPDAATRADQRRTSTRKFLFRFRDGQEAETVYIPDRQRGSRRGLHLLQVGCTLSCRFCHTGTQTLVRNLGRGRDRRPVHGGARRLRRVAEPAGRDAAAAVHHRADGHGRAAVQLRERRQGDDAS